MRHHHATTAPRSAPRRVAAALVTALLALVGLAVPSVVAAPAHAADNARATAASFDADVIHWTNVMRERHGLKPLKPARCVDGFALRHSKRLAEKDAFYHQALRPVIRNCELRTAGENIAWRRPSMTGQQVVQMWMDSPGHRRNILAAKYRFIGTDAFRSARSGKVYAAQVFGG